MRGAGAARLALVWLALFAVYAATLGLEAFGTSQYGGDEPHYLLTAVSILEDRDFDVANQYEQRAYRAFHPGELDRHGRPTDGRLHEPHGIGFPLLIAPAYALGDLVGGGGRAGAIAVELLMATLAALAFVLAIALARRIVPPPWATAGGVLVALSPPALAYGTAVYPELAAGALLMGAALLALRARGRPTLLNAGACGALLAVTPWLGTKYLLPAAVVAALLMRWLWRRHRGLAAIIGGEVVLFSLVAYVAVNERLYGGLTPYAADLPGETATDAAFPGGYAARAYRLVALFLDRDYGLLRWAPVIALAFGGAWLLWRSRRDHIARALPDRWDAEAAAAVCVGLCAAQVVVAAFLSPTMFGFWFPGRHLVAALPAAAPLVAWGLRRAPRWLGATLAALTLLASAWLYVELRLGATVWVASGSPAPWGPLERVFPLYEPGSAWATVVTGAVVAGLAVLAFVEWRHWRQIAGTTRRAYSG